MYIHTYMYVCTYVYIKTGSGRFNWREFLRTRLVWAGDWSSSMTASGHFASQLSVHDVGRLRNVAASRGAQRYVEFMLIVLTVVVVTFCSCTKFCTTRRLKPTFKKREEPRIKWCSFLSIVWQTISNMSLAIQYHDSSLVSVIIHH